MDPAAIDDVAFLTRSEHRAVVLDRLARRDWTRRDLHDATGISQPTLGRILGRFEDRGWVAKDGTENGHVYGLTPLGELLVDEFSTLLATVETVRELRTVADELPFDELDFDLSLLREATVTTATPENPLAHLRRQDELADRADHVRTLCSAFSPRAVRAQRDRILDGVNTGEAVIEAGALETLTDHPELVATMAGLVETGQVTLYRYDGSVPVMLDLFDDTVGIVPLDDDGLPADVLIESDHERIAAWAEGVFDRYRERAERVRPGDLAA